MEFTHSKYPEKAGIYLMKNIDGDVIYIGKARDIRKRLSQYFTGAHDIKTSILVNQITEIEFILTKNETEALILESNMVKNYQPKYNMLLKDSKHFSYLALTKEKFPRLLVARKNSKGKFKIKTAKFFGPFTDSAKRTISARYLRKLFRVRICNKMPKKECLQYHLGNCSAPCIGKINSEDYQKNINSLEMVLGGKKNAKKIISDLKSQMKKASDNLDYELAASLRDQISSLEIFFGRSNVEQIKRKDEDFAWFQKIGEDLHVHILKSQNGVICRSENQKIQIKHEEEPEVAFCMQYYGELGTDEIVYSNLNEKQIELLNRTLNQEFKKPSKAKMKVLEIAANSIMHNKIDFSVLELRDELEMKDNPVIIETFDISTLFGTNSVGSMVRFVNGKPDKSGYRRFKIKTVEGQDDFAMMQEVVSRRYSRILSEGGQLPDLILIDGGPGQLHFAIEALEELGINKTIVSLAKREEEVYLPNKMEPLKMDRKSPALKLLQKCRDEAHRFAITYHRKRRDNDM
ncbi:MAG: excinuclease ABC subunit UvrC [Candidatus Micrarchaeota archaeon]